MSYHSDKTIVGTRMKARIPVRSCNYLWEMVVWIKLAVVKVSEVKIYFGDRADRLDVGD